MQLIPTVTDRHHLHQLLFVDWMDDRHMPHQALSWFPKHGKRGPGKAVDMEL